MHKYGGVYSDLDTWCMHGMDNLTDTFFSLKNEGALLGMISDDIDFAHNIPNAWMASSPGHKFWIFVAQAIKATLKFQRDAGTGFKEGDEDVGAESATGPVILKEAHDTWKCLMGENSGITTLPAGYISISDWLDKESRARFNEACTDTKITEEETQKTCFKAYPNAHVLTYWSHTWEEPPWEREDKSEPYIVVVEKGVDVRFSNSFLYVFVQLLFLLLLLLLHFLLAVSLLVSPSQ